MGHLQSMGVSREQIIRLLGFEHLSTVIIGLGLGTWTGFQISGLTVTAVAVTDTGERIVPPLILETDWGFMIPTYLVLITFFVGFILMLNHSISRINIQDISRTEG